MWLNLRVNLHQCIRSLVLMVLLSWHSVASQVLRLDPLVIFAKIFTGTVKSVLHVFHRRHWIHSLYWIYLETHLYKQKILDFLLFITCTILKHSMALQLNQLKKYRLRMHSAAGRGLIKRDLILNTILDFRHCKVKIKPFFSSCRHFWLTASTSINILKMFLY